MTHRAIPLIGLAALVGALALTSARAEGQSSTFSRAKQAATTAANATTAHIEAMQNVGDPPPAAPRHAAPRQPLPHRPTPRTERPASTRHTPGPTPDPVRAPVAAVVHPAATSDAPGGPGSDAPRQIALTRETFTYSPDGRRDPFVSLIASGELRPMFSDLRLVTVIYDPNGGSVAILRDGSTKEQYRVKAGQTLGRMRVTQILPQSVVFTLEEFGYSRQKVLALTDSTTARSQ